MTQGDLFPKKSNLGVSCLLNCSEVCYSSSIKMKNLPLICMLLLLLKTSLILAEESPRKKGFLLDRIEGSVNSYIVLSSDVRKFREILRLRTQLDPLFSGTQIAHDGANASVESIVEFLIDEKLIAQQFPKTDAEVEQEISSIQNTNHMTRATLKEALTREGFQFADYFELIRNSGSKRDLIDREIRTKVSISDNDVQNRYNKKYSQTVPTKQGYHIQMIVISPKNYRSSTAAGNAAKQAMNKIEHQESFEEVAKQFSDHASGSSGGDLGIITEDIMLPMIREQLKKLTVGEPGKIFQDPTSGSYYILKLLSVQKISDSGEGDPLEKEKEEIRNQLVTEEYQRQVALWIERQRQTSSIHYVGQLPTKLISE